MAREDHGVGELRGQQGEHPAYARAAAGRERVQCRPPDEDGAGAEGQRGEDVGAGADAAVEEDRDASAHGGHHLGQRLQRGRYAVELAAPVVGDDDAGDARPHRCLGVRGRQDALGQHREPAHRSQPGHEGPVQAAVEGQPAVRSRGGAAGRRRTGQVGRGDVGGDREPVAQVAQPTAGERGVDGEHQRLVAAVARPAGQVQGGAVVAEAVQLEPQRCARGVRHLFEGPAREGAHDEREAEGARGGGGARFAVGVGEFVVGHRRDAHRRRPPGAQQFHGGVRLVDAGQRPGPQPHGVEDGLVGGEGPLPSGTSGDEVPHLGGQSPAREPGEVVERERLRIRLPGGGAGGPTGGGRHRPATSRSLSTASYSALMLELPKPRAPLRWMYS